MTPIAIIEVLATLLWCYAALCALAWIRHARKLERSAHIPALAEVLGNLVPAMILLVIVILFGALFGFPSVVVFIALLFPAGLSYGLHTSLADMTDSVGRPDPWPRRAVLALVLGVAISALRLLG